MSGTPAPAAADAAGEVTEFDAAFAESAAAVEAATAPTPKPSDEDRDEGDGGGPQDAPAAATPPAAPATPAKPAAAPVAAAKPAAPAKAAAEPANDIWAKAPPEAKAAHDAAQARIRTLEHADKSNRGRIASYQRTIDSLKGTPAGAAPPGAAKANEALFTSAEFKALEQDYPEVAKPLKASLMAQASTIAALESRVAAQDAGRAAEGLASEEQYLDQRHPDWVDAASSPLFASWLKDQLPYVRETITRNANEITNGPEAADIIGRFKRESGWTPTTTKPAANQAAPAKPAPSARRTSQLESTSSVGSRGPGAASGPPDDFEQAFEFAAKKKQGLRR